MTGNIYYSNKNSDSNFAGDWDAVCQYCGRTHREHIWKEHPDPSYKQRIPCAEQKRAIAAEQQSIVRSGKAIVVFGWVIVPLAILIAGFANWWVGLVFFLFSLGKIGWRLVETYGSPEKWVRGYKERKTKELEHRHYVYHCERNPEGFERLKSENLEKEDREN